MRVRASVAPRANLQLPLPPPRHLRRFAVSLFCFVRCFFSLCFLLAFWPLLFTATLSFEPPSALPARDSTHTPSTMTAYLSFPPPHRNITFHQRTSHFPSLLSARSGRGFGVLGGVLGLVPFPFLPLLLPPFLYLSGCWAVLCWHVVCQLSRQGPRTAPPGYYLSPVRLYR